MTVYKKVGNYRCMIRAEGEGITQKDIDDLKDIRNRSQQKIEADELFRTMQNDPSAIYAKMTSRKATRMVA